MSKGRWQPGQSGNPKGRRPGIIDKRQRMQKALGEGADAIIQVVKEAALGGDMKAADLVLARLVPTLKAEGSLTQFELDVTASLSKQMDQVLSAVAEGRLTIENAQHIAKMLQARAEIAALENGGGNAQNLVDAFKEIAQTLASDPSR